eukprot:gene19251-25103_t
MNTTNLSTIPRQYGPSRVDPKEVDKNTYVQAVDQIEITKLPLVHKFNKNEPWLKVNIGPNEWKARTFQNGNEKGTQGEFVELGWEFILPRNENDREDLVIAVCSHNVVLGRYILLAKDFKNIPKVEDSEYFEIKGKIRNALGKAGRIEIICKHGIADRPKRPKRIDTAIDKYSDKSLYAPINFIPNNINNQITQVFSKILTIALSDLISIHSYDLNSPFITAVCGDWGNDLIGLIGLSMEDFISAEPNPDGVVEINRFITNGKEISGKIKVTAQIRYTINADITNDPSSNQLNETSLSSKLATPLLSPKSPLSPKNDKKIYKFNDNDVDVNDLFKVDLSESKTIEKTKIPISISNIKKITSIPFRINIVSITATDLKAMHILVENSPFINAVCGSWGESTSAINNAGSSAYWFQLNWSFVVNHANSLILTVWTKELPIGRVAIKPNDLLNQIIDNSGNVTLFLKIANKGKVTSGKLKVNCVYEPYIEPNPTESVLKSKSSPSYRPLPSTAPLYRNDQLELPLTVTVLGIALVDLKPIHITKSNSPRVKIACDKQIAATDVKRNNGSAAQWLGLSWKFNIYQVTSDDESIGSLEYDAVTFISIPLSPKGLIDLSNSIYDTQQYITARVPLHVPMKQTTNTTRRNSLPTHNLDVIYEDDDDINRSDKNDYNNQNETVGLLRKQNSQTGVELGLGKSNNQNNENKPHGITPTQFHGASSHNSSETQSNISDVKDDSNEEIDYPLDCTIKRIVLENSGSSAIWNKISFPFIINKDIDLKVIVSSRGKTIGINTFTFFDLVNGTDRSLIQSVKSSASSTRSITSLLNSNKIDSSYDNNSEASNNYFRFTKDSDDMSGIALTTPSPPKTTLPKEKEVLAFVLFMGVVQPWFAKQFAKAIENQPLSNVIAFKDETEKIIKVDALGKPESYGPWVEVGDHADTAVASEVEVDKQKCLEKIWWEEETQSMLRTRELTKSGMFVHQSRTVTPDDKMILINKTTKSDGTSNTFKVIFKRVS